MIYTLNSLRFFAVVFIFLSHLSFFTQYDNLKFIFNNYFYEGYFGVTFFFLLSGFVLSYNYYNKINNISLKKVVLFTKKRLAHVYPVHVITLLISLPLLYKDIFLSPMKNLVKFVMNILLLQSFIPKESIYFSFNAVSWNLSSLLLFYVMFSAILVLIKKITKDENRKVYALIILLILTELILAIVFKNNRHNHWLIYISPFYRLIDCTIGILVSIIYLKNKNKNVNMFTINIMEFLSIIILAIALFKFRDVSQIYRYGVYYAPFLCIIIYVYSFQAGIISRVLKSRLLNYLGKISFSFYMIHQLVIRYILHIKVLKNYPIIMALMCFCISLLAASIIYKYFENPLRKKINLN